MSEERSQQIDEFESRFRRAERNLYHPTPKPVQNILTVLAQDDPVQSDLLPHLPTVASAATVQNWPAEQKTVSALLEWVNGQSPDLIVARRHFREAELLPQFSLGVYVDVLTQATSFPVLLLPGTAASPKPLPASVSRIMALTNHAELHAEIIHHAVSMTPDSGSLYLCHIEDDIILQRYLKAIERIPEIYTDLAKEKLLEELQREAREYLTGAAEVIRTGNTAEVNHPKQIEVLVTQGHHLQAVKQLIETHNIELLVVNTKDSDQMAMNGLAHAIAVEFDEIPLLLL